MQIKNNDLVEKLGKSGFTDKEAKIYVALLELGGAYPSKVAEYTDINRSTVYHTLVNMSVRGLVNEIKKRNKIFYQVERPDKVIKYGESRIRRAEEELDRVKSILPNIEGLYGALGSRPKVTYYEGTDGIVSIYEDMITGTKAYELLAFSNTAQIEYALPAKFFERFRRTKEKMGISARGIVPDTSEDKTYNERFFAGYKKEVIPQLRHIPTDQFPFKGEIVAYGINKVAIVNLNKEFLTGIIIEDETIHKMMRLIFELSWNSSMITK